MCVSLTRCIHETNLVFVHESPDSSSNLTGKQNDQAGKELLERNKKGCVLHMGKLNNSSVKRSAIVKSWHHNKFSECFTLLYFNSINSTKKQRKHQCCLHFFKVGFYSHSINIYFRLLLGIM